MQPSEARQRHDIFLTPAPRVQGSRPGSERELAFGSWTNAFPLLEFGGHSPVTAYCSASMTVCREHHALRPSGPSTRKGGFRLHDRPPSDSLHRGPHSITADRQALTVFPAPFWPTMRVRGVSNCSTAVFSGLNDRMPLMRSLSEDQQRVGGGESVRRSAGNRWHNLCWIHHLVRHSALKAAAPLHRAHTRAGVPV